MPRVRKAPQAPRSRGQIQKRGEDKWLVRVFTGKDPGTGKRRYSSEVVNGTRKQAEKVLTKKLRDVDTETFVEPNKKSLREFLTEWLQGKVDLTERTVLSYESRMETDIFPTLGEMRVDQISQADLTRLVSHLSKKRGLSPRTIEYTFRILRSAFKQAVLWGKLMKDPTEGVKLPKKENPKDKITVLSPDEVHLFLERTGQWYREEDWRGRYYPLWVLLLTSGMRPGEALALKWDDLDGPFANVRRSLTRVRGSKKRGTTNTYKVKGPKTEKGYRRIRLPKMTLDVLEDHRKRQLLRGESGKEHWVFCNRKGEYFDQEQVRMAWKRDLQNCGLSTDVRLYDTRHTHATTLLLRGVNPVVAAERLGHSDVSITLNIYSHVLPELEEKAAAEVEKAFSGPSQIALNR